MGGFFMLMVEQNNIPIDIKISEHPSVGYEIYDMGEITSTDPHGFYTTMKEGFNAEIAKSLASRFHANSIVPGRDIFGNGRPLSAYFSDIQGQLLIEWGEIDPSGEAKLHDFLNKELDIYERSNKGNIVRSGHYGEITLPFSDRPVSIALIDKFMGGDIINRHSDEFSIVLTMINHEILPVTSDGFPVHIQEFENKK